MNSVLDDGVVGLLLLASIAYAFAALSPRAARRRVFGQLAQLLARAPHSLKLTAAAQRLARAADDTAQAACGGCEGCGSEAQAQNSGAEIRVPISSIARRPSPQE